MRPANRSEKQDVAIAGAGTVGLTLALALKLSAPTLDIMLIDATAPGRPPDDDRASAIAASARQMLERLGVWASIADAAQPISEMIITDSRTSDVARPIFLTFAGALATGEPFAHMVPNQILAATLRGAVVGAGVRLITGEKVRDFAVTNGAMTVRLASGGTFETRLLVAADGTRSRLRALAGIRSLGWTYRQSGIVTTVRHQRSHHGRAEEHFLPGGPFAILPLTGNRASLVWTEPRAAAERLLAADGATFQSALELRFGGHLGPIEVVGDRHGFPLGLTVARNFVRPRFALAGDAAHSIHPIAGQGLNLGFKDVAALAETVVEASRLGIDFGSLAVLERYERWRRADTLAMGLVTDSLNRLFSNDIGPLRIVRDIGLGLVDRMPWLKDRFIRQAAGVNGDMPRLLRGEAI